MKRERPVVLVVEPDPGDARALSQVLEREGFEAIAAAHGEAAFNVLDSRRVACLVAELQGRRIDGLALLRRGLARNPDLCTVLVASDTSVERAVAAMREGAHDVQVPPLHPDRLLAVLRRGLAHQALAERVSEMESQLDERLDLEGFTGSSRAIHRVLEQVRTVAPTRAPVVIEGEPGSGRHRLAQMIHHHSPRRGERFVWANCAAPGEGVVEGDLFGYARGAGGAGAVRRGRLELADGGTLYLDEIGDASPGVQLRLLRAIQERAFERVGGTETLHADARLVASTSRDLAADVRAGRFREDLYQRLAVVRIAMPALRERREDIPLLVQQFLVAFNREHGRRVAGITPGAMDRLCRHDWPGNVRELRNVVEGMVLATGERRKLDLSDLPSTLAGAAAGEAHLEVRVGMTIEESERALIAATLCHTGGDKRRAAAMLGIGLRTLYRRIEAYGLD
jgi:DNA-binding NtrC family response regulator